MCFSSTGSGSTDRSLSQALAHLVKVCANDQGGWIQIETLFFHLVRFLHTAARSAIKETTLITLGLIGTCVEFMTDMSRMLTDIL